MQLKQNLEFIYTDPYNKPVIIRDKITREKYVFNFPEKYDRNSIFTYIIQCYSFTYYKTDKSINLVIDPSNCLNSFIRYINGDKYGEEEQMNKYNKGENTYEIICYKIQEYDIENIDIENIKDCFELRTIIYLLRNKIKNEI